LTSEARRSEIDYDYHMKQSKSVIVFGTGNIGTDLLVKLNNSILKNNVLAVGRRDLSPGIIFAERNQIPFFTNGLDSISKLIESNEIKWVVDASSASTHLNLTRTLADFPEISILDLTPSELSNSYIPSIDANIVGGGAHIGLISCGAQSSIPIIKALSLLAPLNYVEVVASLSSKSVGAATRNNIDNYIYQTERAIVKYADPLNAKAILIINPAEPPINMSVSIYFNYCNNLKFSSEKIRGTVLKAIESNRILLPLTTLNENIQEVNECYLLNLSIKGNGDYLPPYAGNLDVLTHIAREILLQNFAI
jgi:acetaldehyde dehydrogenase